MPSACVAPLQLKAALPLLLLQFAKVLGKENVRQGFYGQEINLTTYNLCRINMFLHDINFAAAYADSIIAMKDGRIVAQGPPDEIVTGELLSAIFDTDVRVLDGPKGPIAVYY